MTATLAYIEGGEADLVGVDVEGQPFRARVSRGGIQALGRSCWDALVDLDRAAAQSAHVTTDHPLPDLIGQQGE